MTRGLLRGLFADGQATRLAGATGTIGVAGAFVVTTTSLFLADAVLATPLMIGLFFAGRAAAEIGTDLYVGALSDRMRSRRTLIAVCALLSALGAFSYMLLRDYTMLLIAGALFFGIGGATFGQLFAYTREFAEHRGAGVTLFSSALRSVTTMAWIIGPPLAFLVIAELGFTWLYAIAGVLYLAGAALSRWGMPNLAKVPEPREQPTYAGLGRRTYLLLGAIALMLTVNTAYQITIALFTTKDLGMGLGVPGLLVGVAAVIEIPATLLIGANADRIGKAKVLLGSVVVAVGFFALLPLATSLPALLLLQIPNALWTAGVLSLPVLMLQDEMPDRVGAASALYASGFKAGGLLGGSVTGVAGQLLGYSTVFWVCAGLSALAALLIGVRGMTDVRPVAVTVVVPTYNRAELLRHTLASLARQRLPQRYEVIVVDDGSTDATAETVMGFRNRLDLTYVFQEDQGYRVAAARNAGVERARGEVVVFVDSGVVLHSGALAAHLASHRDGDGPVAVCGYVLCFNEDNEDGAVMTAAIDFADPDSTMERLRAEQKWLDIREEFYAKYGDDFGDLPAPWLMFWTCNVSAPTALVREVGGFDEEYRSWGVEDVDLSYRLHRAGARFVLNRDACAIHVPHPKSYEANMASAAGNYRYFAAKYDTPVTDLLVDNHFFVINDIIRDRGLRGGRDAAPSL
ncbi:MFS transporter [Actinokineospora guangxiensis]|uniref:MFS transporter n=1 Tax=Actinokineospora guangxiensis TaxID=1490288 RepID=A0ABW0EJQ5_9PSEU